MSFITIDAASAIYSCGNSLTIHRHPVAHADFYILCRAIKTFEQALGEAANDEYWATFIRWLRRYRFHMLAAPLPFNWQDPRLPDLERRIEEHITRCNAIYPQFSSQAHDLLNIFHQLAISSSNPLLECLMQVWRGLPEESAAILVKEARLVAATEAVVRASQTVAYKDVDVIAPSQADYARCYQHLFVIGSMYWFPNHIIAAPRANTIHIVSYRWLVNKWQHRPVFTGTSQGSIGAISEAQASNTEEPDILLKTTDFLPVIDARALSQRLSHNAGEVDSEQEDVPARLLVLAGDIGVFVEAADQTKVLTINLDNDDSDDARGHIQRVTFNELAPGMFILLRTEGGGDYIVPVADKLMGPELARRARQSQAHWKSLLRKAAFQRGLFETCIDLIDLGSRRANETNVRNWMASRTIRPNEQDDFRAILRLVGLEADFDTYWGNTEIILHAHRKAGFHIRDQLLRQISVSDLQPLRKLGQMEFFLPKADGGSLTAFRVEHIDPNTVQISIARLGELLSLE